MRWIRKGLFARNVTILASEACLAIITVYTEHISTMSAIWLAKAVYKDAIATALLPQSFPLRRE